MKTKATKAKPAKKTTAKPAAASKTTKAPAKTAASVVPAPKKACAAKKVCATKKPETVKKAKTEAPAASAKKKLTRIVAHVDVGWGKQLYIRGEGAGLSWEQGIPMLCENDTEWHWVAGTDAGPISFKFLIDDKTWALGENITINAGDVHISEPTF